MERGTALCLMEEDIHFRGGSKKNPCPNSWIPEAFAAWECALAPLTQIRQEQGVADPRSFQCLYGKKHFPPWAQHRVYHSRCCLICWEGQKRVVLTIAQSCFALPSPSVVTPSHLPLLPEKELCALLVKVSLSANPMHCRTS